MVIALALGMLVSLLHCAGCDLAFAGERTIVLTASEIGQAPDSSDQQLPAHCGHCLRHVTPQPSAVLAQPADPVAEPVMLGEARAPRPLSGLPLFKPPRA